MHPKAAADLEQDKDKKEDEENDDEEKKEEKETNGEEAEEERRRIPTSGRDRQTDRGRGQEEKGERGGGGRRIGQGSQEAKTKSCRFIHPESGAMNPAEEPKEGGKRKAGRPSHFIAAEFAR